MKDEMQNKNIVNKFISHVRLSLSWIRSAAKPKGIALRDFVPYLLTLERVGVTRGLKSLISFNKDVRACVMNYLSGSPERAEGIRLTKKDKLPVLLGPLIKHIKDQDRDKLRLIMTCLASTRCLRTEPVADLDAIERPLEKGSLPFVTLFARDFWRTLGYFHHGVLPREVRFKRFHFSTKSGPTGHALSSWYQDFLNLPDRLKQDIKVLGGPVLARLIDLYEESKDILSYLFKVGEKTTFRKLSCFPDREGKTRVIAIGDYFTQTVLKGLHSYLYRALKKIPQDCTFDQGAFKARLDGQEWYLSADLKSATDRFPIETIGLFLEAHLPREYVAA